MDWWKQAVFYQIYIRSFQDSNGDGIGDLQGIMDRLDYLSWLGIDALWITPFYPSGQEDLGYDITDFCNVDPIHGGLATFDDFIAAAHARNLRVIIDLVLNHTSRHHPWFLDARHSRHAAYRDWYIWRRSRPGGAPPNNWRGQTHPELGGAWVHDRNSEEWYLANFSPAQPELNWANPKVRSALLDVVRFWNQYDVDGYRLDMVDFLGKDPQIHDEDPGHDVDARTRLINARYQLNRPETFDYLAQLRAAVDEDRNRVLVGEVAYHTPIDRLVEWGRPGRVEVPSNFRLTYLDFTANTIGSFIVEYDAALRVADQWPNYCLGNHDSPRFTRVGGNTRAALVILLTLRGTPFLYYGDEIGMTDVAIDPADAQDIWTGASSRDTHRTPMQWSNAPGVGFTTPGVKPWLPAGDTDHGLNVDQQRGDPDSMLELTRTLTDLRRHTPALREGDLTRLTDAPEPVLAYRRNHATGDILVLANLGESKTRTPNPPGTLLLSTHGGGTPFNQRDPSTELAPSEARVIRLDPPAGVNARGGANG